MKKLRKNTIAVVASAIAMLLSNCQQQSDKISDQEETHSIFPKGELGPKENFTGNAWATSLVASDSTYNTLVGNVYFEPGARSNWHIHPAGQILIITSGEGYHQIQGQARQTLKKGDVITCPPNVMHWHGASPEKGLQQIYIVPNTGKGIVKWLHPVTADVYNSDQ